MGGVKNLELKHFSFIFWEKDCYLILVPANKKKPSICNDRALKNHRIGLDIGNKLLKAQIFQITFMDAFERLIQGGSGGNQIVNVGR